MRTEHILKVISFPAALSEHSNPYNFILCEELRRLGAEVVDYGPYRLFQHGDVFHLHWIERTYQTGIARRSGILSHVAFFNLWYTIKRVKAKGGKVIWTVHNLHPHEAIPEKHRASWSHWAPKILTEVDHVIFMSESSAEIARKSISQIHDKPFSVIRHPHYKNIYNSRMKRDETFSHFGLPPSATVATVLGYIRPYKGTEDIVASFVAVANKDEYLVVAGQCSDESLKNRLQRFADSNSNIIFLPRSLTATELASLYEISAVAIFNFKSILNSGSVITALSLNVPVAAPDGETLRDIQRSAGSHWVNLFENLSPSEMRNILDRFSVKPKIHPELAEYEPEFVAKKHLTLFES